MTIPSNMKLYEFDEVGSTNSLALEKAAEGTDCPAWFTAMKQTNGRGRGAKKWISQEGNLFASFLTRQSGELSKVTEIGFLAALAAYDAMSDVAPHCTRWLELKWPNDILLSHKKVSGILLETEKAAEDGEWYLVAGFGINLKSHPEETDWEATHLSSENFHIGRQETLQALMVNMAKWFSIWERDGFEIVRETWIERGPELGTPIVVKHHQTSMSGSYGGLDNDGGLLMIRDTGEMTKIIVGQVSPASKK